MTGVAEQPSGVLDRAGLAAAFDAHAQDVFRYCARRCDDRALAEDLMSVVFLEAWRSRDRAVVVDGTLRPWLLGIAANVVRNSRRSTRRHAAALDRYRASSGDLVEPDHADAAVDAADAAQTRREIDAALALLSRKDRQVADLCLVEGLSPAQAAVALALPVGTVKSRLAHARDRLREVLRPGESVLRIDPQAATGHEQDEHPIGAPVGSVTP